MVPCRQTAARYAESVAGKFGQSALTTSWEQLVSCYGNTNARCVSEGRGHAEHLLHPLGGLGDTPPTYLGGPLAFIRPLRSALESAPAERLRRASACRWPDR